MLIQIVIKHAHTWNLESKGGENFTQQTSQQTNKINAQE
jgi:hypothetical protein